MSQEVLISIPDDCTSKVLWEALAQTYSQISEAKVLFLKREFQMLKKGAMSIIEFLNQVKSITDQLAMVGYPVSDKEKVQQTLNALGSEYHVLVTSLLCLPTLLSFEELRAKLFQYEMTLKNMSEAPTGQISTHEVLATGVIADRPRGGRGRGKGNPIQGGRGLLLTPNSTVSFSKNVPTCYQCNKRGHIKANCWFNPQNRNRMQNTRNVGTSGTAGTFRVSDDAKDLLLSAMASLNLKQNDDGIWYVDSGAATHVTGNAGKFSTLTPYFGKSNIVTGDGTHHPISNIGNVLIPLSKSSIPLSDVVHAPNIKKNIVSVSKQ